MRYLLTTALLLLTRAAAANVLPIEVGKDVNGFNVPFVSVTICEPGTKRCQRIDRIKLDTGSDGLRIYKSALNKINLHSEGDGKGNDLSMCQEMAGGVGYWGTLAKADVVMGDERAPRATIHLVEENRSTIPCKTPPPDGRNGILGMGSIRYAPNGKRFYACNRNQNCFVTFVTDKQKPLNPLAYTSRNGFIISFPGVAQPGAEKLTGKLTFGIGTAPNSQPRVGSLNVCHSDKSEFLKVDYGNQSYFTKFDTGSNATNVPPSSLEEVKKIRKCAQNSYFLCPRSELALPIKIMNANGSICASLDVKIGHAGDRIMIGGLRDTDWVKPDLATLYGGAMEQLFILGLPFFFGRDIYFGFESAASPLGTGPLVAF